MRTSIDLLDASTSVWVAFLIATFNPLLGAIAFDNEFPICVEICGSFHTHLLTLANQF